MFWRKDGVKLCGFSSQCRCGLVNLGVVRCSCGIVWGIYLRTQRAKAWFWIHTYEKWYSVVLGLWSDVFENRWSPEEEAWGLKFPRTTDGAARGVGFHGKCIAIPPKTSKFQSYKCCACHYAFARGEHAPCDVLLTLRQNNSYYRLFPHSSFTQLESLMTAASTYPTETLFNILQTSSYANYSNFSNLWRVDC